MFVDCLALVKGGKKAAFLWMKENLYQATCGLILDDLDFSGNWLQTTIVSFKDVIAQLLSFSCVPKSIVEGQIYIGDLLRFSEGRLYPDRHVPLAQ